MLNYEKAFREQLAEAIAQLELWAGGQSPAKPLYGICINLGPSVEGCWDWDALVCEAAKTWAEFSGDPLFPVRYEGKSPKLAYAAKYAIPKWLGEYGAARRRLCQHVANWIQENPEKALSFVRGA